MDGIPRLRRGGDKFLKQHASRWWADGLRQIPKTKFVQPIGTNFTRKSFFSTTLAGCQVAVVRMQLPLPPEAYETHKVLLCFGES